MALNTSWLLIPDRLAWEFQKLLIYWDFHTQLSLMVQRLNRKIKKINNYQFASKIWDNPTGKRVHSASSKLHLIKWEVSVLSKIRNIVKAAFSSSSFGNGEKYNRQLPHITGQSQKEKYLFKKYPHCEDMRLKKNKIIGDPGFCRAVPEWVSGLIFGKSSGNINKSEEVHEWEKITWECVNLGSLQEIVTLRLLINWDIWE